MGSKKSDKLLNKYLKGETTAEENALVESWFLEQTSDKSQTFDEPDYWQVKEKLWTKIQEKNAHAQPVKPLWPKIALCAAVILFTGVCIFLFNPKKPSSRLSLPPAYTNDIAPGSNQAILTLSNGSKISLSEADNGKLAEQAGISITKINGRLVYELKDVDVNPGPDQKNLTNIISTPKGGQYQIALPDGTKVWLNSASSLKFPPSFKKQQERQVELNGEAYFEVAKDKKSPFRVITKNQTVQVFGTHFNVNSYNDEENIKTTLLEGSVRVSVHSGHAQPEAQFLKPGQQSSLNSSGKIEITPANIEQVMAWKNGYFHFEKDNLFTVMRQLERWYNVEVIYQGLNSDDEFVGDIPRSVHLSEALKILEYAKSTWVKKTGPWLQQDPAAFHPDKSEWKSPGRFQKIPC
eukprot:gene11688-13647_t